MVSLRSNKSSIYRHYKGNLYELLDIVIHSETLEEMVLYKPLYQTDDKFNNKMWVRPATMFFESIEVDGKIVKRFVKVEG